MPGHLRVQLVGAVAPQLTIRHQTGRRDLIGGAVSTPRTLDAAVLVRLRLDCLALPAKTPAKRKPAHALMVWPGDHRRARSTPADHPIRPDHDS